MQKFELHDIRMWSWWKIDNKKQWRHCGSFNKQSWVHITFYTNKKQHINYFRRNTRLSTARIRLTPHLFWVRLEGSWMVFFSSSRILQILLPQYLWELVELKLVRFCLTVFDKLQTNLHTWTYLNIKNHRKWSQLVSFQTN